MSSQQNDDAPDDEHDDLRVGWSLLSAPTSLGHWLAFQQLDGPAIVLASPGVAIAEAWADDDLLFWRQATWASGELLDTAVEPDEVIRLAGLSDAIARVPADALPDADVHVWMVAATEAHADALERLALLQEHQPAEGVADTVAKLRRVVRLHREEAAKCVRQPLVVGGRTAQEVAEVIETYPASVASLVQRNLERATNMTGFATALDRLENEYGVDIVRDALTGLLFAKHHSHSWQVTKHVRQARRQARRTVRNIRRTLNTQAPLQVEHLGPPAFHAENRPARWARERARDLLHRA